MSPTPIQIRQLTPADAATFRELRLEGLRLNPEAFGSTYDFEKDQPLERYTGWLTNSAVFGAYQNSQLIGTASFTQLSGLQDSHKGLPPPLLAPPRRAPPRRCPPPSTSHNRPRPPKSRTTPTSSSQHQPTRS